MCCTIFNEIPLLTTDLPQLTINLGTAIRRENIREDTDVYLG